MKTIHSDVDGNRIERHRVDAGRTKRSKRRGKLRGGGPAASERAMPKVGIPTVSTSTGDLTRGEGEEGLDHQDGEVATPP